MSNKKVVTIDGQKVKLERRHCANKDCVRIFWTTSNSKHSICSELCWQVATQKNWIRDAMPPVKKVRGEYKPRKFRMYSITPSHKKERKDKKNKKK